MADSLLNDVKMLLSEGKGDSEILKRIKNACERHEVISVYERSYVADLLQKSEQDSSTWDKESKKLDEITSEGKTDILFDGSSTSKKNKLAEEIKITTQKTSRNTPTKKIALGISGLVVALLLVGATQLDILDDFSVSSPSNTPTPPPITPITTSGLSITSDVSSYAKGDIISISGTSDSTSKEMVIVSILDDAEQLVWNEELKIKEDGSFSTLVISGGPGWENAGNYNLKAVHDSMEERITFSFTN
jgi:hypothetical protein